MSDLIDRQAAINTVKKHYRVDNDLLEVIVYQLENLPSAQPEPPEPEELDFVQTHKKICVRLEIGQPEIIRCKDCKHGELFSDQYLCRKAVFWREGDFYCGDAERRTE